MKTEQLLITIPVTAQYEKGHRSEAIASIKQFLRDSIVPLEIENMGLSIHSTKPTYKILAKKFKVEKQKRPENNPVDVFCEWERILLDNEQAFISYFCPNSHAVTKIKRIYWSSTNVHVEWVCGNGLVTSGKIVSHSFPIEEWFYFLKRKIK